MGFEEDEIREEFKGIEKNAEEFKKMKDEEKKVNTTSLEEHKKIWKMMKLKKVKKN